MNPIARALLGLSVAAAAAAVALFVLDAHRPAAAARPAGAILNVTEKNFHIAVSSSSLAAGRVTMRIHNAGPDRHELIILPLHRGEGQSQLPLRPDGFTVNEEALQSQEPGSINPQAPGGTEDLTVNLAPGRYVLFCNMEGHYMAGMHTELVVG